MKRHIYAAFVLAAAPLVALPSSLGAAAEPQTGRTAQQRENMRWRAMDTNGDGRITRAEWRGNDRAFRNHDWNNDGVLSGDEVRVDNANTASRDESFYDWTDRGFRTLDRNRDGRIARGEWDYDAATFNRADRNNDDSLSRSEFLGYDNDNDEQFGSFDRDRGSFNRGDAFDAMDDNGNGRIERREWTGTARSFDLRDRNGDGRLTREEAGELNTAGTSGSFSRNLEAVRVSSTQRWTDTGVNVNSGDRLEIVAEGTIVLSNNNNGNDTANAAGAFSQRRAQGAPVPTAPAGALIARIGDGQPFVLGSEEWSSRVYQSGRLYLGVNDDFLGDNRGEFRVRLGVNR